MASEEKESRELPVVAKEEPPLKQHAVTLYVIIYFKLAKGLLFLLLALWIYRETSTNLQQHYTIFMHAPVTQWVLDHLMHPESQFFINLAQAIGDLTAAKVHHVALGLLLFSLFPLVEGVGMLFRVSWAGWLAISESAFFIPIEFHHLLNPKNTFSPYVLVLTVINIIIVWYLYTNRDVLFRHHHPRRPAQA
jgi:uncharacterized membrane protein (DUF2068 family)